MKHYLCNFVNFDNKVLLCISEFITLCNIMQSNHNFLSGDRFIT